MKKLYSEVTKQFVHDANSLASTGIACSKKYMLNTVAGTEIEKDGNCSIMFALDQLFKRFVI